MVNSCLGKVAGVFLGYTRQCFNMLVHWKYYKFLMVGRTIPKVNTVPCKFTAILSLEQWVDDWIVLHIESILHIANSSSNDIQHTESNKHIKGANYH